MPKYLFRSTYTTDGVRGLLDEGGTGRAKESERFLASLGGRLESFHFGFGGTDTYIVADLPDNAAAAAVCLTAAASGSVGSETVVLLTPEEIDEAVHQKVGFRPPGAR
ncbi:GYD domain-containing protein [Dactylosporangium aurantiacum]|uniref:GYD domain-containing protein n=1 Tax=Dactylosporangium aurantiacum TaxID=35754 RepID=A0A9Q9I7T6_9ACTN|nr:GYD domain-containing protein [Dactylosporangium aurantiacum]MDG6109577.1 GYD domain-containing protein [Dactylosporangium aurantiacum]UWZ51269.1 GYD domain-containing protein [Dactylosporangium aurantiacum]